MKKLLTLLLLVLFTNIVYTQNIPDIYGGLDKIKKHEIDNIIQEDNIFWYCFEDDGYYTYLGYCSINKFVIAVIVEIKYGEDYIRYINWLLKEVEPIFFNRDNDTERYYINIVPKDVIEDKIFVNITQLKDIYKCYWISEKYHEYLNYKGE